MRRLSRRTFLQSATAAALATHAQDRCCRKAPHKRRSPTPKTAPSSPTTTGVSGSTKKPSGRTTRSSSPKTSPGRTASSAANRKPLPVNEPTGGWGLLDHLTGINVTLPTTVEQHHWGKFGTRPYTPEEYRYAADDPIPQNGAYLGVSWWGTQIHIPADWKGKRIFLHIRGARLRAEVFLNKKLVGYSIMEELPFECDLTHAADPGGLNLIGIRLTNPFGRYDWVDGLNAQWGAVKLYRSHGFAGLDRGMTLSAHDDDPNQGCLGSQSTRPGKSKLT